MKRVLRETSTFLMQVYQNYSIHNGALLSAGLAYYTLFSLAPLLVIGVSAAGRLFGEAAVTGRLVDQISHVVGPQAAAAIQYLLSTRELSTGSSPAEIISAIVMVISASLMFAQLKHAINLLWGITAQPGQDWFVFIRTHFLSFLMVMTIALLLIAMMFVSALLVTLNRRLDFLPKISQTYLPDADFGLMFVGFTILFVLIFKLLPDARISWQDVLIGGSVTSLLFTLGEFLIGAMLSNIPLASAYGAMSTVALLLLWVYYSMQIILIGASFTSVFSNRFGENIRPSRKAARVIRNLENGA